MFIRLGFLLLIVAFGLCCFVAGMLAPDGWKDDLASWSVPTFGRPSASVPKTSDDSAKPPARPATSSPAAPSPAHPSTSHPPATASLLVETDVAQPMPAQGQPAYALQLGQYADASEAASALRRLAGSNQGLALAQLDTVDAAQRHWSVVAIGRYVSADAARRAAPRVQATLGVDDLPVIRLPATPPSPAAAP